MAKKIKSNSSLLDELDRQLYEGRWKDIEQILKKIKKKQVIPDTFVNFLAGVELIEVHLLGPGGLSNGQSTEAASVHPDKLLKEAEAKLKLCVDHCQPGHDASLEQLAKIKLGQIKWLNSEYSSSLVFLLEAQTTADTALLFTCKTLLEGFLYIGLCYEKLATTGLSANGQSLSPATDKFQAIRAYDQSLRLAISLVHLAKAGSAPQHPATLKSIETAISRGPVLAIQMNAPTEALNFLRRVLQSKDDDVLQKARLVCTTSLSSLLLFHYSPKQYNPPSFTSHSTAFSPSHLSEESILTSLLAKSVAEAWEPNRTNPSPSPAATFDLLALSLSSANLPRQMVHELESAMKFSCDLPHMWFQFALALVANKQNDQALAVFREAISLAPKDVLVLSTAAKFALEKMCQPELSLKWAKMASEVVGSGFLKSRVEFLWGRSLCDLAEQELSSKKRGDIHKEGIVHLAKAVELDQQNIEYAFHYALRKAEARHIPFALSEARRALSLCGGHTSCLHLLTLILSAQKLYTDALRVCDFALQKQPENFGLLECKAKLEAITVGSHQALQTCKQALRLWQKLYSTAGMSGLIGIITQDRCSLSDIPTSTLDRTATRNSDVSPDVASDAGSSHFSLGAAQIPTNHPNLLQARIWCTIAEVFLLADKVSDAGKCVSEAQYFGPYLSSVLITQGRVLEMQNDSDQALKQYFNALSLQPSYPVALTLVGRLLHLKGNHVEAEKYLREATQVDQLNHESWHWLGEVFAAQGEPDVASDCFKTSLELEATTPIQPFSAVLSSFIPSS